MATVFVQTRKNEKRNSYVVYYKEPSTSKLKYFKTFRKQKEANTAANDLRSLIDTGKIKEIERSKAKINLLSFNEVSEILQEDWVNKLKVGDLSEITFEGYQYRLKILNRVFGNRLLSDISQKDILNYRIEIATDFSNVTSNRNLFVIKQVFKKGLEVRSVFENVAAFINYLSEKNSERNRFLLPHELVKLIEAAQKTRAKYYLPAIIFLGAEHGASKQEILSLCWSKIDFDFAEKGIITFFRTKNKKERTEFLMPRTRNALLFWKKHLELKRKKKGIVKPKTDFVFCRVDGTPLNEFKKAWWRALEIAKIKDFHVHDLRHTYCSNLLLSGASLKDVKELIGHADIKMTDRYSHLTLAHKQIQQDKLAKHYSE